MKLKNFSKERLRKFQKEIKKAQAYIIENPIDLFYLLGLKVSLGTLIVTSQEAFLFVDGRYLQAAQTICTIPVFLPSETNKIVKRLKIKELVFDSRFTSVERYLRLQTFKVKLIPTPHPLKHLRVIKDVVECDRLRKSIAILHQGLNHVKKILKKGITEKQVAFEFEYFCKKKGAEALAFDSIIAFGSNSAMPHYKPTDVALREGDSVLIDIGVVYEDYHSDMTRVVFFGKPDPQLKQMYELIQKSQKAALKLCRPGVKIGSLDRAVRTILKKENKEELFVHSLGHGIGLETHEFPRLRAIGEDKDVILKEGMVFTLEPGLYIPGLGGVRYEDMILITKKGYEILT